MHTVNQYVNGDHRSTDARSRAVSDIRNFISHAVTVNYALGFRTDKPVWPANIFGIDEFAVELGSISSKSNPVNKVAVSKDMDKILRKRGQAVKNPNTTKFQGRASFSKVTISLCISANGTLVAAVYAVSQDDYKLTKDDPWKYTFVPVEVACHTRLPLQRTTKEICIRHLNFLPLSTNGNQPKQSIYLFHIYIGV